MFLRKKGIFLAAAALVTLILIAVAAWSDDVTMTMAPVSASDQVIIIDPGHGGVDGGAVGVSGTVEKRINLEISLRLRDVLSAAGYTVIMTRDTDISIHDSSAKTVHEMKVSDLRNRLAMTRLYPDSLLVSIHQNTLGSSSVTGAQVFFSPNNPQSEVLAQSIQNGFNSYLQPEKGREIKRAGKNLYLFYHAENTAILAECGFLSNSGEEQKLCDEEYQKKIVYVICKGILEYLAENGA